MKMRAILFALLLVLAGCRTVQYIPVETVRTDSTAAAKTETDRVFVRDSVTLIVNGDTVYRDRTRTVYRDRWRTDTLIVASRDSIRVPYPVERELSRWEQVKMDLGGIAIGIVLCAVIALIIAIWIRKRNR